MARASACGRPNPAGAKWPERRGGGSTIRPWHASSGWTRPGTPLWRVQWSAADPSSIETAVAAFRSELETGSFAVVSEGEGKATQVRELPVDADLVIVRRPIAGG